jgi:hypothetical protein
MMSAARKAKTKPSKLNLHEILISAAILLGGLLLIQLVYPNTNLPMGTTINGKSLSGWSKRAAIKELNRIYQNAPVEIFLAGSEDGFKTVRSADFGLSIDNTKRVNLIDYPWYVRIVPTSLFWWGAIMPVAQASQQFDDDILQKFVDKNFGSPCRVEPRNATLSIEGSSINIEKSSIGGTCYQASVKDSFKNIKFTSSNSATVKIDLMVEQPVITTEVATTLAVEVSPNILNDLSLALEEIDSSVTLSRDELVSWIIFKVIDSKLSLTLDETKSSEFYKTRVAPLVEQAAGVTTIIASEDAAAVRINGVEGKVINIQETNIRITEYLRGQRQTVAVAIESTDPSISYIYNRAEAEPTPEEEATREDDSEGEFSEN